MPNPTRTTGHQELLIRILDRWGVFYWHDLKPIVSVDTAFKDAIYKAVERLRRRGWTIAADRGLGYRLVRRGR